MNTVAPPFVSGDNILSSSSVQWTVSWISLTSRISISVKTRDNLDKCRHATRSSMKGRGGVEKEQDARLVQYSVVFLKHWGSFELAREFEGACFEMLKHILLLTLISLLSLSPLFTRKQISAFAVNWQAAWISQWHSPKRVCKWVIAHAFTALWFRLNTVYTVQFYPCAAFQWAINVHYWRHTLLNSVAYSMECSTVNIKGRSETGLRERGGRDREVGEEESEKRDGNLCPSSPVFESLQWRIPLKGKG